MLAFLFKVGRHLFFLKKFFNRRSTAAKVTKIKTSALKKTSEKATLILKLGLGRKCASFKEPDTILIESHTIYKSVKFLLSNRKTTAQSSLKLP